jgi:hypothetical protein
MRANPAEALADFYSAARSIGAGDETRLRSGAARVAASIWAYAAVAYDLGPDVRSPPFLCVRPRPGNGGVAYVAARCFGDRTRVVS